MRKVKYSEYLRTEGAFQVSPATFKRYIDQGVIPGEKVATGTYYAHIDDKPAERDELKAALLRG